MVTIRKDARLLTQIERDQFVAGVKALKRAGTYDKYAKLHSDLNNSVHLHDRFLPWHRAFLYEFQKDLESITQVSNMTIPYWNWAADSELKNPRSSAIWDDAYLGGIGTNSGYTPHPKTGESFQSSEVTSGNFANWTDLNSALLRRSVGRNTQGELSSHDDLNTLLGHIGSRNYSSFRRSLETGQHADAHNWVGGNMADMDTSPIDPVFWLLHGFVDLLYERWTKIALIFGEVLYPGDGKDPQMPTASPLRNVVHQPADIWRTEKLGYEYDILSFDSGDWEGITYLHGPCLFATKAGVLLEFHSASGGKFIARRRALLKDVFSGLPDGFASGIDAMTKLSNGRVCLVKGNDVLFYDAFTHQPLSGLPTKLDAFLQQPNIAKINSICGLADGTVYVCQGDQFWTFRVSGDHLTHVSGPGNVGAVCNGLDFDMSKGFTAACEIRGGTVYAFGGRDFVSYPGGDLSRSDGKRPRPVTQGWFIRELDL